MNEDFNGKERQDKKDVQQQSVAELFQTELSGGNSKVGLCICICNDAHIICCRSGVSVVWRRDTSIKTYRNKNGQS